jgi:hypothetical protein
MSESDEVGFPAVQYAFFTPEGGQWVFRGDTVEDVSVQISDLLAAVDETDGPGLLSDIQALKAAGLLKAGANPAQKGGSAAAASSDLPAWVLPAAAKIVGREVTPDEIKTGIAKSGPKAGQPWYKIGDTWVNQPRGG